MADIQQALAGVDTFDLRASLHLALSYSIPPLTLYHNYHPGANSDLIFGIPLGDITTNRDYVPKVMRMCIEEVERRGMHAEKIYSVRSSSFVSGSMFSVVDGFYLRRRSTTGQWNPSIGFFYQLTDINYIVSCGAGSKAKRHFHSAPQTTSIPLRFFSGSAIAFKHVNC